MVLQRIIDQEGMHDGKQRALEIKLEPT